MTGIVIATHYTLAESLKETVSLIIGNKENIIAVSLLKDDNIEIFGKKLQKAVSDADNGNGVLIFVDMFGGTPSNTALSMFKDNDDIEILSGVNLPLLIEAATHVAKGAKETAAILMERKDKIIVNVKELFRKKV